MTKIIPSVRRNRFPRRLYWMTGGWFPSKTSGPNRHQKSISAAVGGAGASLLVQCLKALVRECATRCLNGNGKTVQSLSSAPRPHRYMRADQCHEDQHTDHVRQW